MIKKTATQEIAEAMAETLGFDKEAFRNMSLENFKTLVDEAKTCEDLQLLEGRVNRVSMAPEQAAMYLNRKKQLLCKQEASKCLQALKY